MVSQAFRWLDKRSGLLGSSQKGQRAFTHQGIDTIHSVVSPRVEFGQLDLFNGRLLVMHPGDIITNKVEADTSNPHTGSTANGLLMPLGRGNFHICNEVWLRRGGAVVIGGQ